MKIGELLTSCVCSETCYRTFRYELLHLNSRYLTNKFLMKNRLLNLSALSPYSAPGLEFIHCKRRIRSQNCLYYDTEIWVKYLLTEKGMDSDLMPI